MIAVNTFRISFYCAIHPFPKIQGAAATEGIGNNPVTHHPRACFKPSIVDPAGQILFSVFRGSTTAAPRRSRHTDIDFMNPPLNLQIWLKDGSMLKDWALARADIQVAGLAFDMNTFDKLDDAYLYALDGSKIYRDRVTGTVDVQGPGVIGSLKLAIDQIDEMVRSAPPAPSR